MLDGSIEGSRGDVETERLGATGRVCSSSAGSQQRCSGTPNSSRAHCNRYIRRNERQGVTGLSIAKILHLLVMGYYYRYLSTSIRVSTRRCHILFRRGKKHMSPICREYEAVPEDLVRTWLGMPLAHAERRRGCGVRHPTWGNTCCPRTALAEDNSLRSASVN